MSITLREAFAFKNNFKSIFIPSPQGHRSVDGLRAICCIWVICHHFALTLQGFYPASAFHDFVTDTPWWFSAIWHGELAVDIFFVLSGYLIGATLLREYKKTGTIIAQRFYLSRLLRLFPCYLLAVLVFLPLLPNKEYVWANLIQVVNYMPFDKIFMPWTWSLALQEQFYVLLPPLLLVILLPSKNRIAILMALLALSVAVRVTVLELSPELKGIHPANFMFFSFENFTPAYFEKLYSGLHVRFGSLIVGLFGAYVQIYHAEATEKFFTKQKVITPLYLISVAIIAYTLLEPYYDLNYTMSDTLLAFQNAFNYPVFAFATLIILFAAFYAVPVAKPITWFMSSRFWYAPGQVSFVMYLFHMLFVGISVVLLQAHTGKITDTSVLQHIPMSAVVGFMLLSIVLSFVFSLLISALVERPFMNMRKMAWFKKVGKSKDIKGSEIPTQQST